jgi:sugar phosphate isomerase/epimerase
LGLKSPITGDTFQIFTISAQIKQLAFSSEGGNTINQEESMELKVSVWSNYFKELTPEDRLKEFSTAGFRYLEFSTEDGEILLGRGKPAISGGEYRKHAADAGITVLQGHLDLEANILNRAHVEGLKVWLELFNAIGIKNCVLHYEKSLAGDIPPQLLLEKRGEALLELKKVIAGTDMRLCLENLLHDRDAQTLLGLIKYAGEENMGICLDTGHLNLAGGNPSAFVAEAGPLLHALHIADNEGYYDQHFMPYFGRSNIPWAAFMRTLGPSGYQGLFNFEIGGTTGNIPPEILRLKLAYVRGLAGYMESLANGV